MRENKMIQSWLDTAARDEPVWIGDVRKAAGQDPNAVRIIARLLRSDGGTVDFTVPIPRTETVEGLHFVWEYLRASVFNILAVHGGQALQLIYDWDMYTVGLVRMLPGAFQVIERRRSGYGKAVSVANRINRALGGRAFNIIYTDKQHRFPAPEPHSLEGGAELARRLKAAAERAERGLYCGVDVGGTDVKLVLARDGNLLDVRVLDWDPSQSPTAEGIIRPLMAFIRGALEDAAPGQKPDGMGVSFPDVVIRDRIVGGETPKTKSMREHTADYEAEFSKITGLKDTLAALCAPGAPVHIINDGHMAAFTAAMEMAHGGREGELSRGVIAHTLGTDLGTGWLEPDGSVPEGPMELYDLLLNLGSVPSRALDSTDLRSVRNENSGLPGARRYMGQAAAFRLAWALDPSLLDGFIVREGESVRIRAWPDMRKPCLEHLMQKAEEGHPAAREVFRRIGTHLGQVCREEDWLLRPGTDIRWLFGRFVKSPACFDLLREGCASVAPHIRLEAADEGLANTPVMKGLARQGAGAVAQYGQAVGALYYALF